MAGLTMMHWQMACNRLTQPCGCATWLQWESGAWVSKSFRCNRHEVA